MLNLRDAIKLYSQLKDFIPDPDEYDDTLKFTGKIISDIGQSETPEVLGESILLMYPKLTLDELAEKSGHEVINLFLDGLLDNKFLALSMFCRNLGYG